VEGIRISNKEYRQREGISSSELKKIMITPAHYKHWKDNPQEDTPALLFGRAAHKYILETYDFYTEFAVAPNCDRRTKEGKETWNKFVADSEGKDVITQEQFEQIDAMRNSAYATPFVSKLLSGEKELSFWGVDEETGLKIKCRPDCITEWNGKHILIDYKTASDVENMKFYRDSIKFGYDLQLAMYREILRQNTGHDYMVVIIAQEKTAPYVTNVFQLSENYLQNGEVLYKEMLKVYKECEETDNWYGYMKDGISILGQPDDEDMESEE
jgi:exodeoxyribonuclease VIII